MRQTGKLDLNWCKIRQPFEIFPLNNIARLNTIGKKVTVNYSRDNQKKHYLKSDSHLSKKIFFFTSMIGLQK